MSNSIKITSTTANEILAITSAGKSAWCVVDIDGNLISFFASRDQARQAKTKTDKLGKSTEFNFEVVKETKVNKNKEIGGVAIINDAATEITHESTIDRPCKKVWEIADGMKGQKRGLVLAACVDAGIAYYTARTQYQQWLSIQNEMKARESAQSK